MTQPDEIIFVVDDDARVLAALHNLLKASGYHVRSFDTGEQFLAASKPEVPSCVILDLNLGATCGLDVQRQVGREAPMPVIFLTGCDDVSSLVRAMKAGACDYLIKPVEKDELLPAVRSALDLAKAQWQERKTERELRCRYASLTPREREVLPYVVQGFLNKQTAYELGTSDITIRIHRGSIMRKMKAGSLAGLVRLAGRLGVPQDLAS
jgi:FixJ family two-component response regulator